MEEIKKRAKRATHEVDPYEIMDRANDRIQEIFSIRLNNLLTEREITQTKIAEDLKVSTGYISKLRNGHSMPKSYELVAICDYLNVSSDYLLGLSNVKTQKLDIKAMCEKTGLSENAITNLMIQNIENIYYDHYNPNKKEVKFKAHSKEKTKTQLDVAINAMNVIFESPLLTNFLFTLGGLLADEVNVDENIINGKIDGIKLEVDTAFITASFIPYLQWIIDEMKKHKNDKFTTPFAFGPELPGFKKMLVEGITDNGYGIDWNNFDWDSFREKDKTH